MHKYRKEHTEKGFLFVYVWVKSTNAPFKASAKPFGFEPLRVIWNTGTKELQIDAQVVADQPVAAKGAGGAKGPLNLVAKQLPPETRYDDAVAWLSTSEGQAWAGGDPAELIVIQIEGQ